MPTDTLTRTSSMAENLKYAAKLLPPSVPFGTMWSVSEAHRLMRDGHADHMTLAMTAMAIGRLLAFSEARTEERADGHERLSAAARDCSVALFEMMRTWER